jgi:hypothetical protein
MLKYCPVNNPEVTKLTSSHLKTEHYLLSWILASRKYLQIIIQMLKLICYGKEK